MSPMLPTFVVDLLRLTAWLAILSTVMLPIERLFTLRPAKWARPGIGSDLAYYFLNGIVPNVLLAVPTALLALLAQHLLPSAYLHAIAAVPWAIRLVAGMLVAEIGSYWGHRWSHEIPVLWRFHAVHHSPEHIDYLVNTRAHPIDMVFTRLCGLLPVYVLGLAHTGATVDTMPVAIVLFATVWSFFIHANVRWRFGWLEWLISTPAFHHWHHTNDENRDRNYAALLPLVDRMFGTLHLPKTWPPCYGIDAPIPDGVARQLLHPVRAMVSAPPSGSRVSGNQVSGDQVSAARAPTTVLG